MTDVPPVASPEEGPIGRLIGFFLRRPPLVLVLAVGLGVFGLRVAPFDWSLPGAGRDPVPVDAIPDIGENQQIVFTRWPGRSPQDIEDQVTYPLTTALLGVPGVKSIRSYSMLGFSSVFVIFKDDVEFYWSRSRILEKLNSLPGNTLPDGIQPSLGPDATGLGQVFWYTLEGRDADGQPAEGWEPQELRSIQDWLVRYELQSVEGVAEVASVGGHVREYQIDLDPDAMRAHRVTLPQVMMAVKNANVDVGARTIEINRVEYVIRGLGFVRSLEDLEQTVVTVTDNVPITIKELATVQQGPALRRGILDKEGAEAVGGVVVVRYGANPMTTIQRVKAKIAEISGALPVRTLADGRTSRVTLVPFYDRSGLIRETLGTLERAISQQILVTIIVVLVMVIHLRSCLLISGMLPLAVLMAFGAMKLLKVDANIVALSGIAIAIGTIVDMGVILCENALRHLEAADPGESPLRVVHRASSEVGGAVLTAVATTVVSFLPVFAMTGAEGKLFGPLAWTKTFALIASIAIALVLLPALALLLFAGPWHRKDYRRWVHVCVVLAAVVGGWFVSGWLALALLVFEAGFVGWRMLPETARVWTARVSAGVAVLVVWVMLTADWNPLGHQTGLLANLVFTGTLIGGVLGLFRLFLYGFEPILRWALDHKLLFLSLPAILLVFGGLVWQGAPALPEWVPTAVRGARPVVWFTHAFPGMGKEFMPKLGEGSYLYMPTIMAHGSIGEATEVVSKIDRAIASVPEVSRVVGKMGRVDSPLDPAPIGMMETVILYHPEYLSDENGEALRFRWDAGRGEHARDAKGMLVSDPGGKPYRMWRPHIKSPADIWKEIDKAAQITGMTSAPPLQPIETRIVMLQTGMRASLGIKIKGDTLEQLERFGVALEKALKQHPEVNEATVVADRIVGKPYIEIEIDRARIARYGIQLRTVQDVIEVAIGGKTLTWTVEGRERYPVRVRYRRELRDSIEQLGRVLVAAPGGAQVPLDQLAEIRYARGPQVIKTEDARLVAYLTFDKQSERAEVDIVEMLQTYLADLEKGGTLKRPDGVTYEFAGSYQNQLRAAATLAWVLPLALATIFVILYLQFENIEVTFYIFTGIAVAWAGGFIMIWLYGQGWFMNFDVFGTNLRGLFQMHQINLSVAIWVGFLALFGIATDDGVVVATYLQQTYTEESPRTVAEVRDATVTGAGRRIRPCLMTTATTILALLPVLTSAGRGSDIMVPMAIPTFGGMTIELVTLFVVPTLDCWREERRLRSAPDLGSDPGDLRGAA